MSKENDIMLPVFITGEALSELKNMTFAEHNFVTMNYTFEPISFPYYFYFEYENNEIKMSAFMRSTSGTADVSDSEDEGGYALAQSFDGEIDTENMTDINVSNPDNYEPIFKAGNNLNLYLQREGLDKKIDELDPEDCGILITAVNGKLSAKTVEGYRRPALSCVVFSLFRMSVVNARPYRNELMDSEITAENLFGEDADEMKMDEIMKEAEAGNVGVMLKLAKYYMDEEEKEKAFELYKALSEKYDIGAAQYNLSALYLNPKRDFEKSAYWMIKAAENGDSNAANSYKSIQEIAETLKKAEAGDPDMQAKFSALLYNICEDSDDEDGIRESFEWAKKSAEQNCPEGICTLALCYSKGRGVDIDEKKAEELFMKGAKMGHAASMTNLAAIYGQDENNKKKMKKAFELFKKAAELGNGTAMRNLGHCYQYEKGTKYDMDKAREWYIKAAEFFPNDEEFQAKVQLYKMGF